ncbi:MAG: sigma-70 family RNA polymerase sigma factor [Luteitalea sp.]|nr:sigma-70 family RNA polymerase sigma factor [Luteitalea sp.]
MRHLPTDHAAPRCLPGRVSSDDCAAPVQGLAYDQPAIIVSDTTWLPSRAARRPAAGGPRDSTVEILDRAQRGDRAAIQDLIGRAAPSVRRWARGRLPRYVRQDVVQDAVLQTLKSLERVRHRTVGGLQAYLRTSVLNRIRDLIRGAKRHGIAVEVPDTLPDDTPSPLEIAIRRQGVATFLAALRRLKPSDRQVIIWRIELGYTVEEIAAQLGKSKPAAGMSVSRAVARLAKELGIDRSRDA